MDLFFFFFFSPGGAQPSSLGAAEGSRGAGGCSQPSAAWAAPPSGRHLLLVAQCTARPGWSAAESAAAGTECWSITEPRGRYGHLWMFLFKHKQLVNLMMIVECFNWCLQLQKLREMTAIQVIPEMRLWFTVLPNGKSAWKTASNSTSCCASP